MQEVKKEAWIEEGGKATDDSGLYIPIETKLFQQLNTTLDPHTGPTCISDPMHRKQPDPDLRPGRLLEVCNVDRPPNG